MFWGITMTLTEASDTPDALPVLLSATHDAIALLLRMGTRAREHVFAEMQALAELKFEYQDRQV